MGTRPEHLNPGKRIDLRLPDAAESIPAEGSTPLLILLERGHWCSSCRRHLALVGEHAGELHALGYRLLAVTHESQESADQRAHPFSVIGDPDLAIATSLGLVHVDEFGSTTIRPSTLLIDPDGTIRFSYVGDDSRDRPTIPALLLALRSLPV